MVTIVTRGLRTQLLVGTLLRAPLRGYTARQLAREVYSNPAKVRMVWRMLRWLRMTYGLPVETLPGSSPARYRLTGEVSLLEPTIRPVLKRGQHQCRCDEMANGAVCVSCRVRALWRAGRMTRKRPSQRWDRWQPRHDDFLRTLVGRTDEDRVALFEQQFKFPRSASAIAHRMRTLGLASGRTEWTAEHVTRLFGVARARTRFWFTSGLLRASRGPCPRGGAREGFWRVTEAELERFIRECPWEYDASAMDQSHRLALVARQVARNEPYLTVKQVARHLSTSEATVRRMIRLGRLPARIQSTPEGRGGVGLYRVLAADVAVLRRAAS